MNTLDIMHPVYEYFGYHTPCVLEKEDWFFGNQILV